MSPSPLLCMYVIYMQEEINLQQVYLIKFPISLRINDDNQLKYSLIFDSVFNLSFFKKKLLPESATDTASSSSRLTS